MRSMALEMATEPRKRKYSRKAPAVKAAVIAGRVNGKSKTFIANELGITRNTVRAIINESDIDRQIESGGSLCAGLIPRAVDAMGYRLDHNDLEAAKFILQPVWNSEKIGITGKAMGIDVKLQQAINVLVQPSSSTEKPQIDVESATRTINTPSDKDK